MCSLKLKGRLLFLVLFVPLPCHSNSLRHPQQRQVCTHVTKKASPQCSSFCLHADALGRTYLPTSNVPMATFWSNSNSNKFREVNNIFSPDVLPLSHGCERTPTCPAGSFAAQHAAQNLVSGLQADGQPDKSLPGHIPQSEPAVLLLLATYLHWCMCSAQENTQRNSMNQKQTAHSGHYNK